MNNQNNAVNTVETAATAALAAASKTPFLTAFKITLGIALAQIVTGLLVLTAGAATVLGAALIYTALHR